MHATCAGLEQVAEQGHEQLHARQALAQTPGTPQTKEELVDSEYGSGQDTEPLKPSSSGDSALHMQGPECRAAR